MVQQVSYLYEKFSRDTIVTLAELNWAQHYLVKPQFEKGVTT